MEHEIHIIDSISMEDPSTPAAPPAKRVLWDLMAEVDMEERLRLLREANEGDRDA